MSPRPRIALGILALALFPAGARAAAPFARTEAREPCGAFDPLRRPFFGDLHVHTRFSADAYIYGTRVDAREAYDFMRGLASVTLADDAEAQTRSARIGRPLDFGAVTDHAEFFGEVDLCSTPGSPAYDDEQCQLLRRPEPDLGDQLLATVLWLNLVGTLTPARTEHRFCSEIPGIDCDAAAASVWQEIQAAAEAAYDRSAACTFTSFVGFENTASPVGRHLHRNVIFRNARVPAVAASHLETFAGGTPQGLWSAIETDCLAAGSGCDALVIPHNSNLSGGEQFVDPADAAEAARRQALEPLVELHQQKGNAECRFDRLAGAGAGTADELCTFEQRAGAHQGPGSLVPIETYPPRNLVRNALKEGLRFEQTRGVNPFRMGFVGSTDTHNGTGGNVAEAGWVGGEGNNDSSPPRQIQESLRNNPGGLAVAWAEENSRDALFEAFRRRETYATSGTRPIVRFFAGDLSGVACGAADFVRAAYAAGTPMGGEIGPVRGEASPRFALWALKDAGTAEQAGTDLQRVQIVKGWVDGEGTAHERVFDVAGDATRGGVDPATCAPAGAGFADLCTVWEDPSFVRGERAFYYARVLETPTCRWSTLACRSAGVDPLSPDCAAQAAGAGPAFAGCCLGPDDDPFLEPLVQERAWTSPVWYRPEGVARVTGRIRFARRPGRDVLAVNVWLGDAARLDLAADGLVLRVADAGEIATVTLPPGTLRRRGGRRLAARLPGVGRVSLAMGARPGPRLRLTITPRDLSHVARTEHMVTVAVESGLERFRHTRLWTARGRTLEVGRTRARP